MAGEPSLVTGVGRAAADAHASLEVPAAGLPKDAGAAPPDTFKTYLEQNKPPSAASPLDRPATLQMVQRPETNTLGHDVLDTIERYSGRVASLQKMGTQWRRGMGALGPDGAGPAASHPLPALANIVQSSPATPPPADPATADVASQYRNIFADSMGHQAELFSLVVEVDLGRQVSSTATSTAKTLLTQSG